MSMLDGRSLYGRLSELNDVAERVFTNNLPACYAVQNIVSEFYTISLEL